MLTKERVCSRKIDRKLEGARQKDTKESNRGLESVGCGRGDHQIPFIGAYRERQIYQDL